MVQYNLCGARGWSYFSITEWFLQERVWTNQIVHHVYRIISEWVPRGDESQGTDGEFTLYWSNWSNIQGALKALKYKMF